MILGITIFTIVANLYLGIAVLLRNTKSATNRLFALYALFIALWALANYFALIPGLSAEISLLRIRITMVVAAFLCPIIYLLAYTFPDNKYKIPIGATITFWIFIIATAIISVTPLTFSGVIIVNGFPSPIPGPGILVYALNALVLPVMAFIIVYKKFKQSTGRVHLQMRMFMTGLIGSFALAEVTNFIIVNVFKHTELAVLGPLLSLVMVGSVFYAITRYRFLDIKLIILRSVTYITVLVFVGIVYIGGIFVSVNYLFPDIKLPSNIYWFLMFLSFAIVAGITPMYRGLEKIIGKYFFKSNYDSEKLIFEVMQIMATEVDFDLIAPKVLNKVTSVVGITKSAILVVEHHRIVDVKEKNYSQDQLSIPKKLGALEDLFHITNTSDCLLLEDTEDESLKEVFRSVDAEVILPIRIEEREVAIIIFGQRSSGDMYTERDLSILKIIGKQIGEIIESTHKFKMLKTVDKIRSDFIDSVSHEFRTPLTESRWKLEMLLDPSSKTKLPVALRKDISNMYLSIKWLVESLNQLIFVSEFQEKSPELRKELVNIKTFFVKKVFSVVEQIANIKKVTLDINVPEDLPPIEIDEERMRETLSIIVENAIKYSPDKSTVSINIVERTTPDMQKFLRITIADQGIGIDEKDLPHLFTKFYRGTDARHSVPNGLGIGLYIAKNIIELHDGKLWVESTKGKGSTFYIELPY